MNVEDTVLTYWRAIDAADWSGVAATLDDDFVGHYPATGEQFDKPGFVRLNEDYPGRWRAEVLDTVVCGDRCATRVRVRDAHGGPESHQVVGFASVHGGRIDELVEVWAEEGTTPPVDRRPPEAHGSSF